ncbi:polysaccharide biosynthesis protein [Flavisericum labens]|uniref:polysaccharide biosynthesis protein n=1 Tax=Flavisericum labens TaxID=3377112 RepID=UPI00387B2455
MNKSLASQIDQLLIDSGLFQNQTEPTRYSSNFNFSEETILITGAAGTIGSELYKQLINSPFKQLILVDMAESPLYSLIKAFEFEDQCEVEFHLLNINDFQSLSFLFKKHNPTIVFHTAAYKHVPLMEKHPMEAIQTNIFGTKLLAELSIEYMVKKFIFVSTDKAVKPASIMGMSKRISEKHLTFLNSKGKTAFFITRFGNILGSNGSIVPLVKEQLENGTPITITHPEISRYFICKSKACNLILKIAHFDKTNENMFTFDMGAPIKIMDLIERLAKIYSKELTDVEVKYTGLRPGEKLFEDITTENETLTTTYIDNILLIKEKRKSILKPFDFSELKRITPFTTHSEIKSILKGYL